MSTDLEQCEEQQQQPSSFAENDIGKKKATAALVLGIIAILLPIPFLDLACGIVGLVLANGAKKDGFTGSVRTAGFVLSLIGTVYGALHTLAWLFLGGLMIAAFSSGFTSGFHGW